VAAVAAVASSAVNVAATAATVLVYKDPFTAALEKERFLTGLRQFHDNRG